MMLEINPGVLSIEPSTPNPAGAPANLGDLCQYQAHCQKLRLSVPAVAFMRLTAACHGSGGQLAAQPGGESSARLPPPPAIKTRPSVGSVAGRQYRPYD